MRPPSPPPPPPSPPPTTEGRILEAAGGVFAERSYRGATVREICGRAGANVAAVNYHFGGKERLYGAVLRHAHASALSRYPRDAGLSPKASPEERLRVFIRSFLWRLLDPVRPAWHGRLMVNEMAQPTRALDAVVARAIRPQYDYLAGIVGRLLGPRAVSEEVRRSTESVVGQCLFFRHAQPVLVRLHRGRRFNAREIDAIAGHIFRFSLNAMKKNRGRSGPVKK